MDWKRICELFDAAHALPRDERNSYLDATVGDDRELRTRIEDLLRAADDERFLAAVEADDASTLPVTAAP